MNGDLDKTVAERLLELIREIAGPGVTLAPDFYGFVHVGMYVRGGRPHGHVKVSSEVSSVIENGNGLGED